MRIRTVGKKSKGKIFNLNNEKHHENLEYQESLACE